MRSSAGLIALSLVACTATPSASDDPTTDATSSETTDSPATETSGEPTETETETGDGDGDEPPGNLLLSDQILNIAHRGGGRLRPEETLLAYEHALAVGAEVIEMDVHASLDGVVILMHDDTVDRTTDGSGMVKELTLAELQALDAGYDFTPDGGRTHPYRGMDIRVPTLDEVLDTFPDTYYLIEIKQSEPSIVPAVLASLDAHDIGDRVVLASFYQVTIDEVRAGNPELFTAMSFEEMVEFYGAREDPSYTSAALFVQAPWEVVDQPLVDFAHSLGLKVHPWTVNGEPLMNDLVGLGVDGIMTDDPVLLESVIDE